jgi:hypothetical protein
VAIQLESSVRSIGRAASLTRFLNSVIARERTKPEGLHGAGNKRPQKACHHEKRSDVVIQQEFQVDCGAPPSGNRNDKRCVD